MVNLIQKLKRLLCNPNTINLIKRVLTPNVVIACIAILFAVITLNFQGHTHEVPEWIVASQDFDELFDSVASDLGFKFRTYANPNREETHLLMTPLWALPSYRIQSTDGNDVDTDKIQVVLDTIQSKFQEALDDSYKHSVMLNLRNSTRKRLVKRCPKTEAIWLNNITQDVYPIVQQLFGRQIFHRGYRIEYWFEGDEENPVERDPILSFHYDRSRGFGVPPSTLPNSEIFIKTGLPWCPIPRVYNAQWPRKITTEEILQLESALNEDDRNLLFSPYTTVKHTHQTYIEYPLKDQDGNIKEYLVKTPAQNYQVLNIMFDRTYRGLLLDLVTVLQNSQKKFVKKTKVKNNATVNYPIELAKALSAGDFDQFEELDWNQPLDPILFTFNPYGHYWDDHAKGSFQFIAGHVEQVFNLEVDCQLEDNGVYFIKQYLQIDTCPVDKQLVLVWPTKTAGYLRALNADPISVSYPKQHSSRKRVVLLLDVIEQWNSLYLTRAHEVLAPVWRKKLLVTDYLEEEEEEMSDGSRGSTTGGVPLLQQYLVYEFLTDLLTDHTLSPTRLIMTALGLCLRDVRLENPKGCYLMGLLHASADLPLWNHLVTAKIITLTADGTISVDFEKAAEQQLEISDTESDTDEILAVTKLLKENAVNKPIISRGELEFV